MDAVLLLLQIKTLAEGKTWSIETSPARNYVPHLTQAKLGTSTSYPNFRQMKQSGGMTTVASYSNDTTSMEAACGMSRFVFISYSQ